MSLFPSDSAIPQATPAALRQLIEFKPLNLLSSRYEVAGPFTAATNGTSSP